MMERDINILMADGCTKEEAKKHLHTGTAIFDQEDLESNFDTYMQEWDACESMRRDLKHMIETKESCPSWGWNVVEFDDNIYYIMYVL